jgi:hypothetical protein
MTAAVQGHDTTQLHPSYQYFGANHNSAVAMVLQDLRISDNVVDVQLQFARVVIGGVRKIAKSDY